MIDSISSIFGKESAHPLAQSVEISTKGGWCRYSDRAIYIIVTSQSPHHQVHTAIRNVDSKNGLVSFLIYGRYSHDLSPAEQNSVWKDKEAGEEAQYARQKVKRHSSSLLAVNCRLVLLPIMSASSAVVYGPSVHR